MVGEGDVLRLEVVFNGSERDSLPAAHVSHRRGDSGNRVPSTARGDEGTVLIAAVDGEAVLPAAILALSRRRRPCPANRTAGTEPRTVFLHLTGRGLRE